ncbi:endonuclease VIII [Myxosarcina sp. GI1]|uniref:endonuclease VIII n=1 Tax=Myxosarcina sp. GI1 TaxID=1541065 RepID=UPI00056B90F5|nr:endonuclease VIII [Myxosarcina sp. GI1]
MPEGPEVKLEADKISDAIASVPVETIFFAFEHLKPYEAKFAGCLVIKVAAKGKALLIHFDNQLAIYSHNQLYGKWMIRQAHDYPQTNRQLRLAIHNLKKSALLYSASDIEVLDKKAIATHPFLSRLGLDVLNDRTTSAAVVARLQDKRFLKRRLTALLLDQHFLAGVGNYLRSEILFVARVHPTLRPIDCSERQLQQLSLAAIAIPQQSYQTKGITNDIELAAKLKAKGYKRQAYRHWVFNREEEPCFVCGTAIVKETSGGRRYYYCPQCQAKSQPV